MHRIRVHATWCFGTIVATLLCASVSTASDIAYYIGGWDPGWYDERQFEDVSQIIANTEGLFSEVQTFDDEALANFDAWARSNLADGELDIIWLNGSMPSVLYPFPNLMPDGSLAELWLDDGNMIINTGGCFGILSYECGGACEQNNFTGAANILDLNEAVQKPGGPFFLRPTDAGMQYMPSIPARPATFRPIVPEEVTGDWELAAIFAQNTAGTQAEPCVLHNTQTDGYLAIINQSADFIWIDRASAVSEFLNLWMVEQTVGYSTTYPPS